MEGEVTMICVDTTITSITSLCWFHDQIRAVKTYCGRKLNAHPNNLVGIATFGQRDLGICLYPTKSLQTISSKLRALKPLEREYTDLLQGFQLSSLCWLDHAHMKKRILVFSRGPLHFITDQLPDLLKVEPVALDIVHFGTRPVKDKEDSKALIDDAIIKNDNNNEGIRYFLIEDDGFSLSHHISSSSVLPPLSEEVARLRSFRRFLFQRKAKNNWGCSSSNYNIVGEEALDSVCQ